MTDAITVDSVFADLVADTNKKFGAEKVISIDTLNSYMYGFPCPLAWSYAIGGSDVVPCGRVFGGDGPPKHYKSTLSMEHGRWVLQAGGVVVLVDTEDKTSDTLARSLLWNLEPEVRKRFRYVKAASIEAAEELVTFFKKKAIEFRSTLPPEMQFPVFVIWDSLTGAGTEGQNDKVNKEGSAEVRGFSEQAMSISKFYKSMSFDDSVFNLMHVQHAKPNNDPYALLDDRMIPNGGTEPKFKATYHYRMTKVKDIKSEHWMGKEISMFMLKSSLGADHRELTLRVLWRHEWVDVPAFSADGKVCRDGDKTMTPEEAVVFYDACKGALPPESCVELMKFFGLLAAKPPEKCPKPATDRQRFQQTWFDWDWTLGKLLCDLMYEENELYADDKKALRAIIPFTKGAVGYVVSKKLFGDDDDHDFSEFGKRITEDPELTKELKKFWGITHYQSFHEYVQNHTARPKEKSKKEKEKEKRK